MKKNNCLTKRVLVVKKHSNCYGVDVFFFVFSIHFLVVVSCLSLHAILSFNLGLV